MGERETRARLVSEWNQIGIVAALLATSAFGIAGTTANELRRPCTFRDATDDILTPCVGRAASKPLFDLLGNLAGASCLLAADFPDEGQE